MNLLVTELHLLEFFLQVKEYLHFFDLRTKQVSVVSPLLYPFSEPNDPAGYGDRVISDDLITDIYLEFCEHERNPESSQYSRTLTGMFNVVHVGYSALIDAHTGQCISLDMTFKGTRKAVVVDSTGKRHRVGDGGILAVINENSEVIAWVSSVDQIIRENPHTMT